MTATPVMAGRNLYGVPPSPYLGSMTPADQMKTPKLDRGFDKFRGNKRIFVGCPVPGLPNGDESIIQIKKKSNQKLPGFGIPEIPSFNKKNSATADQKKSPEKQTEEPQF